MITTFIVGLSLGLLIGWLRLRVVVQELTAANEQRRTLSKALKQSSELHKLSASVIEKQQAVIAHKDSFVGVVSDLVN